MPDYANGNLCNQCNDRLHNLFYRVGINHTMQVRHVGKVCKHCKRFWIVNKEYVEVK